MLHNGSQENSLVEYDAVSHLHAQLITDEDVAELEDRKSEKTAVNFYNLGHHYLKTNNRIEAFNSFKNAHQKGHTDAASWLAKCYLEGIGTEKDAAQAKKLCEQAKTGVAYHLLGEMLENNQIQSKNYFGKDEEINGYYEKSIQLQGAPGAYLALGERLLKNKNTAKRGRQLIMAAAVQGDKDAIALTTKQSELTKFSEQISKGNLTSLLTVAQQFANGSDDIEANPAVAVRWYKHIWRHATQKSEGNIRQQVGQQLMALATKLYEDKNDKIREKAVEIWALLFEDEIYKADAIKQLQTAGTFLISPKFYKLIAKIYGVDSRQHYLACSYKFLFGWDEDSKPNFQKAFEYCKKTVYNNESSLSAYAFLLGSLSCTDIKEINKLCTAMPLKYKKGLFENLNLNAIYLESFSIKTPGLSLITPAVYLYRNPSSQQHFLALEHAVRVFIAAIHNNKDNIYSTNQEQILDRAKLLRSIKHPNAYHFAAQIYVACIEKFNSTEATLQLMACYTEIKYQPVETSGLSQKRVAEQLMYHAKTLFNKADKDSRIKAIKILELLLSDPHYTATAADLLFKKVFEEYAAKDIVNTPEAAYQLLKKLNDAGHQNAKIECRRYERLGIGCEAVDLKTAENHGADAEQLFLMLIETNADLSKLEELQSFFKKKNHLCNTSTYVSRQLPSGKEHEFAYYYMLAIMAVRIKQDANTKNLGQLRDCLYAELNSKVWHNGILSNNPRRQTALLARAKLLMSVQHPKCTEAAIQIYEKMAEKLNNVEAIKALIEYYQETQNLGKIVEYCNKLPKEYQSDYEKLKTKSACQLARNEAISQNSAHIFLTIASEHNNTELKKISLGQAAATGDADAQYQLSTMLDENEDAEKSIKLLTMAALQGHEQALNEIKDDEIKAIGQGVANKNPQSLLAAANKFFELAEKEQQDVADKEKEFYKLNPTKAYYQPFLAAAKNLFELAKKYFDLWRTSSSRVFNPKDLSNQSNEDSTTEDSTIEANWNATGIAPSIDPDWSKNIFEEDKETSENENSSDISIPKPKKTPENENNSAISVPELESQKTNQTPADLAWKLVFKSLSLECVIAKGLHFSTLFPMQPEVQSLCEFAANHGNADAMVILSNNPAFTFEQREEYLNNYLAIISTDEQKRTAHYNLSLFYFNAGDAEKSDQHAQLARDFSSEQQRSDDDKQCSDPKNYYSLVHYGSSQALKNIQNYYGDMNQRRADALGYYAMNACQEYHNSAYVFYRYLDQLNRFGYGLPHPNYIPAADHERTGRYLLTLADFCSKIAHSNDDTLTIYGKKAAQKLQREHLEAAKRFNNQEAIVQLAQLQTAKKPSWLDRLSVFKNKNNTTNKKPSDASSPQKSSPSCSLTG